VRAIQRLSAGVATALLGTTLLVAVMTARAEDATDPKLVIVTRDRQIPLGRSELVRRADLETIEVDNDEAYPKLRLRYQAVKLAALLSPFNVAPDDEIRFTASDGYASRIPYAQVSNAAAAQPIAYLAIEDPRSKWPPLHAGESVTAGPYYVVSSVSPHSWPWSVTMVTIGTAGDEPVLLPAAALAKDSPEWLGYRAYAKNCWSCHTLNGAGPARMGPDLNLPMNPTEYFRDGILGMFIRDQQSVRRIPGARMPAFSETDIPDAEMSQLLAYLRHMAGRKVAR
jgi:mono/diheme cytochrome c family protein